MTHATDQSHAETLVVAGALFRPDWLRARRGFLAPGLFGDTARRRLAMAAVEAAGADGAVNPSLIVDSVIAANGVERAAVEGEYHEARIIGADPFPDLRLDEALRALRRPIDREDFIDAMRDTLGSTEPGRRGKVQSDLGLPDIIARARVVLDQFEGRSLDPLTRRGGDAVVTRLCDVEAETLAWVWRYVIPLGKLTLVGGNPGVCKSFAVLDIAARVSSGTPFFDCRDQANPAGDVVIMSAEDDLADTIRPRLDAAGADVSRIVSVTTVRDDAGNVSPFCLERDLPKLERVIVAQPRTKLVAIDPVTAFCGKTDSHNNAEVRGLLAPLAELAARHRVAVILVTHLNKSAGTEAIYRLMGSLAFGAAARMVWAVVRDQADARRRLLVPVKTNIGADDQTGLAFSILNGSVAWEAERVRMTADEALRSGGDGDDRTERDEAAEWLADRLADGPVPAADVIQAGGRDGHTLATLRRAKKALDVRSVRAGFGSGGGWGWALPDGHRRSPTPIDDHTETVSAYGAYGKSGESMKALTPPIDAPIDAHCAPMTEPPIRERSVIDAQGDHGHRACAGAKAKAVPE